MARVPNTTSVLEAVSSNSSSNDTATNTEDEHGISYYILVVGFNILVCCMVLVNNTLILTTLVKTRRLHTLPNAYIASMAVADLLVGVMMAIRNFWLLPRTEYIFNDHEFVCLPVICLLYISAVESLTSLVLIALDRYFYMVHPFWYERHISAKVAGSLIAASWVFSVTVGSLPLVMNEFTSDIGCDPMRIISKEYLISLVPLFFFSAIVISFLYGRVFCVGYQQRKRIESQLSSVQHASKEIKLWKIIRFLVLVCGLFFLCWTPLAITVIVYFTTGVPYLAISIAVSVTAFNCGLNFYVFIGMNNDFKSAVQKLICCFKQVGPTHEFADLEYRSHSASMDNGDLTNHEKVNGGRRTSLIGRDNPVFHL